MSILDGIVITVWIASIAWPLLLVIQNGDPTHNSGVPAP